MKTMKATEKRSEAENKFHWLFLSEKRDRFFYDTKIGETQNFVVLPTKGSLVAGWVLIVPKFPVSRMADVSSDLSSELLELIGKISEQIQNRFGQTFTFEHGGLKGSPVSCGVDQAHLHIAPLAFDLIEASKQESPGGWNHTERSSIPKSTLCDAEYWFASSERGTVYKRIQEPCSQFFRKVIAKQTDQVDYWDYNSNDFLNNVAITIRAIQIYD